MKHPRSVLSLRLCVGLCVVVLVATCGSIFSLHPLFADKDLVIEPRVEGSWQPDSGAPTARWVLRRLSASDHDYLLFITDSGTARTLAAIDFSLFDADSATHMRLERDPALRQRFARDSAIVMGLSRDAAGSRTLSVQFGRLAGELFADMTEESLGDDPRPLRQLSLPMHWFWRVAFDANGLVLTPLSDDWLSAKLDSGKVRLAHESAGNDNTLLTASTAELQRFVTRYAKDSLAFSRKGSIKLQRR